MSFITRLRAWLAPPPPPPPPKPDRRPPLAVSHRRYPDSVQWALSIAGVSINALPPVGTPGMPVTVQRILAWFGPPIIAAAKEFGVPIELIVATIATESAGGESDPLKCANARREEPGFVNETETPDRVSLGLMQTLLSTARAALKNPALTAADLCQSAISIRAGTAFIAMQCDKTGYDPPLVAAAYNAGGLYYDGARENRWRLRCYPTGTGAHIDRFVAYFNDAVTVLDAAPALAGDAPRITAYISGNGC